MANKEHEHESKEQHKEAEHHPAKEAKKEPKVYSSDQVLRLVTEVIHGVNPQPDPAVIKDVLNSLQAKLHEEK